MKVSGTFEVKMDAKELSLEAKDGVNMSRYSLDKTYHGDLNANGLGEMLSAVTTQKGSAGYVAIEQVSGSLSGRKGSFVLQHFATMNKGNDRMILEVIPDSGSDELKGLNGKMNIVIEGGKHRYEFDYTLD